MNLLATDTYLKQFKLLQRMSNTTCLTPNILGAVSPCESLIFCIKRISPLDHETKIIIRIINLTTAGLKHLSFSSHSVQTSDSQCAHFTRRLTRQTQTQTRRGRPWNLLTLESCSLETFIETQLYNSAQFIHLQRVGENITWRSV